MNILMITANDPAGMGIAFTDAINRYTEHTCRLTTTDTRYNFDFKKDIHIPDLKDKDFEEVESLLRGADVFHFHILSDEDMKVGPFHVRDYIKGKSIVHHHHGHPFFKENSDVFRDKYKKLKRKIIISTPDLLRLIPEATWIPNIVPINNPLYRPLNKSLYNGYIKAGHSPTRKDLKGTDIFERVIGNIRKKDINVEKVVISNTSHKECLKVKRKCNIFFDQIGPSFGVSSLEALSQGIPTMARLDSFNVRKINEFTGCSTNAWICIKDEVTLEKAIVRLIQEDSLRSEKGRESREFMEKYWDEKKVLDLLFQVYSKL